MANGGSRPYQAAAGLAPMGTRLFGNTEPNLLHVTNFLTAAERISAALRGLERIGYHDVGLHTYLVGLIGAAKLVQAYIVYLQMAFTFFAGRVYCRHSGALVGIQENHLLVGELNVGAWSAEEYARMSFPGQKEFEDGLRVRFYELWDITQECVETLARINVPGDGGLATPLGGPAPSVIDTEMPGADESDDIDQPAIAKSEMPGADESDDIDQPAIAKSEMPGADESDDIDQPAIAKSEMPGADESDDIDQPTIAKSDGVDHPL